MTSKGLHQTVVAELGAAIVAGKHAPGDVLRLDDLGEQWSVSRTVVREAIRVLESLHMVEAKRHVGVIVAPPERWSVYDPRVIRWRLENVDTREAQRKAVSQLRMAIEPTAALLASMHGTPEERELILDMAVRMAALNPCEGDRDEFNELDIIFHTTLLTASHNELFAALTPVMREAHQLTAPQWSEELEPDPEGIRLHIEAGEAIIAGDGPRAERCLRSMVSGALFFEPDLFRHEGDDTGETAS